jgi:hypothetical protein
VLSWKKIDKLSESRDERPMPLSQSDVRRGAGKRSAGVQDTEDLDSQIEAIRTALHALTTGAAEAAAHDTEVLASKIEAIRTNLHNVSSTIGRIGPKRRSHSQNVASRGQMAPQGVGLLILAAIIAPAVLALPLFGMEGTTQTISGAVFVSVMAGALAGGIGAVLLRRHAF